MKNILFSKEQIQNMLYKYRYFLWLFFILLVCFLYGIFINLYYRDSLVNTLTESSRTLHEVIDTDRDARLQKANEPIYFHITPADTISTHTKIERDGEPPVYIEKTDSMKQMPLSTIQNNVIQSFLLHENPIDVVHLDSLFQVKLSEKHINAKTAIQYTDHITGKTHYSNPDTTSYARYVALKKIKVGFENEITLQAFIKISPVTVIRRSILPIGGVTLVWLLLMSISVYGALRKGKVVEVPIHDLSKLTRIQITDHLLLDMDRNCFIYRGKEIGLTELTTQFLGILLSSPDYFAGYDELIGRLYGGIEENAGKMRLSKMVTRINNEIKPAIPEIEVKNVIRKGYQFYMKF